MVHTIPFNCHITSGLSNSGAKSKKNEEQVHLHPKFKPIVFAYGFESMMVEVEKAYATLFYKFIYGKRCAYVFWRNVTEECTIGKNCHLIVHRIKYFPT